MDVPPTLPAPPYIFFSSFAGKFLFARLPWSSPTVVIMSRTLSSCVLPGECLTRPHCEAHQCPTYPMSIYSHTWLARVGGVSFVRPERICRYRLGRMRRPPVTGAKRGGQVLIASSRSAVPAFQKLLPKPPGFIGEGWRVASTGPRGWSC